MLLHLSLRDFVIVPQLELDVQSGFTVLTGETGAGKSILIDALQLLLGGRADANVVRQGMERTQVSAEFLCDSKVRQWLERNGLSRGERTLLLRRTVDRSGRSRAWINGIAVTATQLRDLGNQLVAVHGQHAHQDLLQRDKQLTLLDSYAHLDSLVRAVSDAYDRWSRAFRKLEEMTQNVSLIRSKVERLQWMLDDLGELQPKKDEWNRLVARHQRLSHGAALLQGFARVVGLLTESESSAVQQLVMAQSKLMSLSRYDERLEALVRSLQTGMGFVEEVSREVERLYSRSDMDEETFREIDDRVTKYYDLARKFRVEPERLFALQEQTEKELHRLTTEQNVELLQKKRQTKRRQYKKIAHELSLERQKVAFRLSQKVTERMQGLAMEGARLEIALRTNDIARHGLETCEFLIAGHAGVDVRPLRQVASGGELARVSLAIAVITAHVNPVSTLIFDEVDSGIGGATAEVVGRLLRQLGETRQVLCVTHLPQVAACGHQHWRVEKKQREGKTISHLQPLSSEARIEEVARMLAGVQITQKTKEVAKDLLGNLL